MKTVEVISGWKRDDIELIIVDNNSDIDISSTATLMFENLKYLRLGENLGAVARNRGIEVAVGKYVLCLDDDVVGIESLHLDKLQIIFTEDSTIAAVSFKIYDPASGEICNWIHHYDKGLYCDKSFPTNEISEGAVCFRKEALDNVGMYYESYFISHEGPDLACRLLEAGYRIIYSPDIVVAHFHSAISRKSWRRYYYDTRNVLWLAARNYPLLFAIKYIFWGVCPMLIYAIRDGYLKYWLKGIIDGVVAMPRVIKTRRAISSDTLDQIKKIEAHRPHLFVLIKSRLFRSGVRI